jgi:hypothetical protein
MKTHSGSSLLILLIMAIGLIAMMAYIINLQTRAAKPQPSERSTASDSLKDRSTTRQWVVQGGGDK